MKRDQIFGGIGIAWGAFTLWNWYSVGRPVSAGEAPFAWVYITGAVAGAIMMTVGLFYFLRGSE
jgi:hypothetical protein